MNSQTIKVYLCQQKSFTYECKMFNNLLEADNYYYNNIANNKDNTNSQTYMLPICKFTPKFMHNFIIKYKIFKQHKLSIK